MIPGLSSKLSELHIYFTFFRGNHLEPVRIRGKLPWLPTNPNHANEAMCFSNSIQQLTIYNVLTLAPLRTVSIKQWTCKLCFQLLLLTIENATGKIQILIKPKDILWLVKTHYFRIHIITASPCKSVT